MSVALLAGGLSTRMGENKAFVEFQGGSLLEWLRDRTARLFPHVFLVVRDPSRFQDLGIPVVNDALEERGSAVGIYSAILAAPADRVLCMACDMPLVPSRLLWALFEGAAGFDAFLPRHDGLIQPLCCVYSKRALPVFLEFIRSGRRRVTDIFSLLHTGYLDVGDGRFGDPETLFLNVNTPEELAKARQIVADGRGLGAAAGSDGGAVGPCEDRPAVLQPRIRAFMNASPFPIVSFIGKKNSGKTTVLLGVIRELCNRGYRLAVIKHDAHSFEIDVPGTDSYRIREAGAVVVGISSPEKYAWVVDTDEDRALAELVSRVREPVDLVITEGFKQQDAPKIEVSRRARSTTLVAAPDELIGIAADQAFPDYPVPGFALEDFVGLADLIEKCILGRV
jgi:molybdopterin-guanine dinucleotide biosynthesis protein MobB